MRGSAKERQIRNKTNVHDDAETQPAYLVKDMLHSTPPPKAVVMTK